MEKGKKAKFYFFFQEDKKQKKEAKMEVAMAMGDTEEKNGQKKEGREIIRKDEKQRKGSSMVDIAKISKQKGH